MPIREGGFVVEVMSNREFGLVGPELDLENLCWVASYWDDDLTEVVPGTVRGRVQDSLFLKYADTDDPDAPIKWRIPCFNISMARQVAGTLWSAIHRGVRGFVFSCDAGISRSAGMAEAFVEWLREGGHPCSLSSRRTLYPNVLVKGLCLRALKEKGVLVL